MSAQCCPPLAGLRSDHMGFDREPRLQRRRRPGPAGPARSCSPPLRPPPPPAGSRKPPDPGPPTPPGSPAEPEPAQRPEEAAEVKPRPSRPHSQSQPSRPVTSSAGERDAPIETNSELRARGQRSGGQRSEYHRQFNFKPPAAAASPILTAEQVFHASRSVPPFKKTLLPQETEYQRSFQGLAPPTGPRLRKHLEQQRTPLFHMQLQRKRREESQKKLRPKANSRQQEDTRTPPKATPPSSPRPHVHRRHRTSTEYQSSFRSPLCRIPQGGGATEGDAHQMTELRQQAQWYRRRAWGTNFSRDHLSQLQSEHTALWEPVDSPTDPPTPAPHSHTPSCVDALDLASNSSPRWSAENSGGHKKTSPAPPAGRRTAWGGRGEEEEDTEEEEEGRLPTPRLKTRPVQRTHHDLTTPATGGAILVGKLKTAGDSSPFRQRCESSVSMTAGAEPALWTPVKQKEAWPEKVSASPSLPSPDHKPASKPIRVKPTPPPAEALPPQHGLHGKVRHADFQHNGDLGLRLKEAPCSGGCCSDEDERMSVMSWRSAASCSAASVVLDRALKRRDDFWGKT